MIDSPGIHEMPKAPCPVCNIIHDAATAISQHGEPPEVGDYTFCSVCLSVLQFTSDFQLRALTKEELSELEPQVTYELFTGMLLWGFSHRNDKLQS